VHFRGAVDGLPPKNPGRQTPFCACPCTASEPVARLVMLPALAIDLSVVDSNSIMRCGHIIPCEWAGGVSTRWGWPPEFEEWSKSSRNGRRDSAAHSSR
jgi:hypothetical protein